MTSTGTQINEDQGTIIDRDHSQMGHTSGESFSSSVSRLGFKNGCYDEAEKAMAPHSSTSAWKIPWTEEPGGLQSMRSLRVGQD